MAGFDGTSVPAELRAFAKEYDLGGVVLFARNVESAEQVAELAMDARHLGRDLPAWVGVDQEGGRVARLREPFTRWPPMSTLGRSGDDGLAARFATALARELAAVGISLDFAPVLDVLTRSPNPAIGDRALSTDADVVSRLGGVLIETWQTNGIAACAKHFPGHGDTSADSHDEMPLVEADLERLRAVELQPFRAAVAARVASVMVGHLFVPALDDREPATLSRTIIRGLLRDELGFDGVVFTDDLDMKAVADRHAVGPLVVGAIDAGCDGLLLCGPDHGKQVDAVEALIHAIEDETLPLDAIERSMSRHRRMKERFIVPEVRRPRPGRELETLIGAEAHQIIAHEMAQFA